MDEPHHGRVTEFDEASGLGVVTDDAGTAHPFHCTEIVDGTRSIAVGTDVTFRVLPRLGRWEAGSVAPVEGGGR